MWQQFNLTIPQLLLKTLNHLYLISLLFFYCDWLLPLCDFRFEGKGFVLVFFKLHDRL